ncbi:MAG: SRPBCC family protein [Phaeodactylibacter sp.]|nr:SRPBCC family protein [Phaeodactylibacter sp.]
MKETYDVIADYEKAPQWITGLKKVEPLEGTPGKAGFVANYIFEERGRKVIFHEEVTVVEPYNFFQQKMEGGGLATEGKVHFQEQQGDTRILMKNKVWGKSLLMKLFLPLMKGMMKRRQMNDLQNLKLLVEREQRLPASGEGQGE